METPAFPDPQSISLKMAVNTRWHGPDDPRVLALRESLVEAKLAKSIRKITEGAPALSVERIERLTALLHATAVR